MARKKLTESGRNRVTAEKGPERRRPGRPPVRVDKDLVFRCAKVGCTYQEIATIVGCSESVLLERYRDVVHEGWSQMRRSLRRKQLEVAMQGNVGMLIWLGKQYLGQKDKVETALSGKVEHEHRRVEELTDEELREVLSDDAAAKRYGVEDLGSELTRH